MRYLYLLLVVSLLQLNALAQTDTTKQLPLEEVVISANKFKENKKNVAQNIQVIDKKETQWMMPQTSAVMLEQTGNVFVQKSQLGGGSPTLRGFEASRVLLVIDGIRMNNAIYRTGHLQNIISVDNNILERTEVLFGPASTLYGSDALGGIISFKTKDPLFAQNQKTNFKVEAMTRFSSAYHEQTGHFNINFGKEKWASLTSVTYSSFGDLRQGASRNPFYSSFGWRGSYITQIDGIDSVVKNNDPNVQKGSSYNQIDIMQKFIVQQNQFINHSLNFQYSTTSNVTRYDRLTDIKNGNLRWAEWYYGPQERMMLAYQLDYKKQNRFFNEAKFGINYQAIEESRHQREYRKTGLQNRIENVGVIGYFLDFRKTNGNNEITFGTDGQLNRVNSTASLKNISTNESSPLDTRYPSGGSNMNFMAAYFQHIYKIIDNKLILNDGFRINSTNLTATLNDTTFFKFPFSEIKQQHLAWSGNIGLIAMPTNNWRIAINASTGFRSPNVDDLTKIFESAGGVQLVVPNPNLKPENSYNLDLNIAYNHKQKLRIEATGFYTQMQNAIVLDNFKYNGLDSINYGGNLTKVVAPQNKAKGTIYGGNLSITVKPINRLTMFTCVNYTFGEYENQNGTKMPLDHIPPVFGKMSMRYQTQKFGIESFILFNGWKKLKDYNPNGEDNLQYATVEGMPEWYTINLRSSYQLRKNISIEAALENILDVNYRTFSSGISAPGRNFVMTLRGNF